MKNNQIEPDHPILSEALKEKLIAFANLNPCICGPIHPPHPEGECPYLLNKKLLKKYL